MLSGSAQGARTLSWPFGRPSANRRGSWGRNIASGPMPVNSCRPATRILSMSDPAEGGGRMSSFHHLAVTVCVFLTTIAPAFASGGARDLVVIPQSAQQVLVARAEPVTFKASGFFLAEWDEEHQAEMRAPRHPLRGHPCGTSRMTSRSSCSSFTKETSPLRPGRRCTGTGTT